MAAIQGDWYASAGGADGYPADPDPVRFVYATQPNGEKYIVAKVWAGDDRDYEGTARLVSATPDLLEACELLLIYLADWDDKDDDTCATARRAIAKARGKEVPNG